MILDLKIITISASPVGGSGFNVQVAELPDG